MKPITRRAFLATSSSCAGHLALAAFATPALRRLQWTPVRGQVVAAEPFGRLEQVAEGVWALISTPLSGDRTTLSNGGLIAGRNGVLAIEGFNQPEGARWLAERSKVLTGRWPTHVVVTHYHADHANGVQGYLAGTEHPVVHSTAETRDLVIARNLPAVAERTAALHDAQLLSPTDLTTLDLGGRRVTVRPAAGHTPSDVSVEIADPSIMFCGDLVWNAMFPNYVDAMPTVLARSARALRREKGTHYVPGHGALATEADFDRYLAMLDEVEHAAREAHAKGIDAATAGAAYALPTSLGEWTLFNKVFFERAFGAWYKELGG
ncbi:MAG: MBL fold metallo-hydrolase [Gemmatimonadetes bacterium]|nr:MBL fold metallo-hydrolase [Gemmatimonadota bacterium]